VRVVLDGDDDDDDEEEEEEGDGGGAGGDGEMRGVGEAVFDWMWNGRVARRGVRAVVEQGEEEETKEEKEGEEKGVEEKKDGGDVGLGPRPLREINDKINVSGCLLHGVTLASTVAKTSVPSRSPGSRPGSRPLSLAQ
jgi:hypothetical protein